MEHHVSPFLQKKKAIENFVKSLLMLDVQSLENW